MPREKQSEIQRKTTRWARCFWKWLPGRELARNKDLCYNKWEFAIKQTAFSSHSNTGGGKQKLERFLERDFYDTRTPKSYWIYMSSSSLGRGETGLVRKKTFKSICSLHCLKGRGHRKRNSQKSAHKNTQLAANTALKSERRGGKRKGRGMENSSAGQDSSTFLEKQDGGFPKICNSSHCPGFCCCFVWFLEGMTPLPGWVWPQKWGESVAAPALCLPNWVLPRLSVCSWKLGLVLIIC